MAVSKQLYQEAASIFLQRKILQFPTVTDFDHVVRGIMRPSLLPFVTTVHIEHMDFEKGFTPLQDLSFCSSLRHLHVTLANISSDRYVTDDLDARYFNRLRSIKHLLAVKSLRSVTLHYTAEVSFARGASPHLNWSTAQQLENNLAALSNFISLKLQKRSAVDSSEYSKHPSWNVNSDGLRRSKRIKLLK